MTSRVRDFLKLSNARAATTRKRLATARRKSRISKEEVERWEYLMDPDRCSIQEFIENFRVATKEVQDDGTVQQQIVLWPAQVEILKAVADAWASGHAAKIVIVKDREQGCSFFIQALFYERYCRGGGGEMRTVSHKDEATLALQTDFHSFRMQTPDWVFTDLLGGEWLNDAPGKWKFMWPGKHFSVARTMTCRDGAMGRGDRTRWAHYSEYPWWPTGKGNIGGALATLRDTPGNIYIFESTGKDFDEFYTLAYNAREGKNGWTCLFLSWLTHPGKRSFFRNPHERAEFADSVGKLDAYDRLEEQALFEETKGDLERLKWRREQIDGPVCNGDVAFFAREHPRVFSQAFYADTDSVFDPQILDSRQEKSMAEESRVEIGSAEVTLENGRPRCRFVPSRSGPLRIYRHPVKGRKYCFGADPSQGKKVVDLGKRTGDYATVILLDVESEDVCALYRAHTPPEEFAQVIYSISMYYGWAPGYVESNADGRTVLYVANELEYLWRVRESPLLPQARRSQMKNGEMFENHVGFLSDSLTKPVAVNRLKKWVRDMGILKGDGPSRIPLPLLTEMRMYVYEQTFTRRGVPTGRVSMSASKGHDDTISAAWMAFEAREYLKTHPERVAIVDEDPRNNEELEQLLAAARAEMTGGKMEAPKLWYPRGGRSSSIDTDPAEIPGMAGY